MNTQFSIAAFDRIARGVAGEERAEASWMDALSALVDESKAVSHPYVESGASVRLRAITGLVALGHRCGYLDVTHVRTDPSFLPFVSSFGARSLVAKRDTTIPLQELLNTLSAAGMAVASSDAVIDPTLFTAFEAYLDLTIVVMEDTEARRFLDESRASSVWRGDAAALVSPRHFVAALEGEPLGISHHADVSAGLRALRYLQRLAETIEALETDRTLLEDFVAHARWAADLEKIERRFDRWADAMRDWLIDPGERASGQERWERLGERVFTPLIAAQQRQPADWVAPPKAVEHHTIESLIEQGRLGTAARVAAENARDAHWRLTYPSERPLADSAQDLVDACFALSRLGGNDEAASYLAVWLPLVTRELPQQVAQRASHIVATAARMTPPDLPALEAVSPAPPAGRAIAIEETKFADGYRAIDLDDDADLHRK
jgi:hypothetical protein